MLQVPLGLGETAGDHKNAAVLPHGVNELHIVLDGVAAMIEVRIAGPRGSAEESEGRPVALAANDLQIGQKIPNQPERDVVGAATSIIKRGTSEFSKLVKCTASTIVFKDEEGTGADRMTTSKLEAKLTVLAGLVQAEWSGVKLRVTEASDENMEHGTNSVHYEARGAY